MHLGASLVTCNNEVTTDDLVVAVEPVRELETEEPFETTLAVVLSQLDTVKLAIKLTRETGENAARGAMASAIGDFAEAEVVSALAEKGLAISFMNTEPNARGINIVAVDLNTDKVSILEVKSTLDPKQARPSLSAKSKSGRQASQQWVEDRLEAAGFDRGTKATDVDIAVVHVNLFNRTMQNFSVDGDGRGLTATSGPVAMEDAP